MQNFSTGGKFEISFKNPKTNFYKSLSFPLFIYFIYPVHNIFKLSYTFKKLEESNIYSNENIDLPPVEKFCIIVNILKEP